MDSKRVNWLVFCILIFVLTRLILVYQYNMATNLMFHNNHTNFYSAMCKWDCKWYLTIINEGYDSHTRLYPKVWRGLANWAFFPLYPLCVKVLVSILGTQILLTGIVLNQVFILIAMIFFYQYLRKSFDENVARIGVVFLAISPFSVYFVTLYTEALFLMLSILSFYFMKRKNYLAVAICGGLLSATRPVGIMIVFPLLISLLRDKVNLFKIIQYLLIASAGLLLYMLFLHFKVGDFLAFEHIQKAWGRTGWNTNHLAKQLWKMASDFHNSILFAISVMLSGLLFIKKYYEEAVFNLACILPGVMTGQMMSEGRFCGTLFTFYFGFVILSQKSWTLRIILLSIFFLLYLSYYTYWLGHANFLI